MNNFRGSFARILSGLRSGEGAVSAGTLWVRVLLHAGLIVLALLNGWSPFDAAIIFWLETVVIGMYTVLGLLISAIFFLNAGKTGIIFQILGATVMAIVIGAFYLGVYFFLLVTFGGFAAPETSEGLFHFLSLKSLNEMSFVSAFVISFTESLQFNLLLIFLGQLLTHGVDFLINLLVLKKYAQEDCYAEIWRVWNRMNFIHVFLLSVFILFLLFGLSSPWFVAVWILLKLYFELAEDTRIPEVLNENEPENQ